MRMKVRDFLHEPDNYQIFDDYSEEYHMILTGPVWLTLTAEQKFARALALEVEFTPGMASATVLVKRPDKEASQRNLQAMTELFKALTGLASGAYNQLFLDHDPNWNPKQTTMMYIQAGISVDGTPAELKTLLEGSSSDSAAVFVKMLTTGRVCFDGASYVPIDIVAGINERCGTRINEDDYELHLPHLTIDVKSLN